MREQRISIERLKLEASGALHIEDPSEAANKIRDQIFGKYTKEQLDAAALAYT